VITIVVLLIALPFALLGSLLRLAGGTERWRRLDPTEQNLQRCSHGAVCALLPVAAVFALQGTVTARFLGQYPAAALLLIGAAVPLMVCGIARFVAGWRRCAGVRDGLLTLRAFVKLCIGAGLALLVLSAGPMLRDARFALLLLPLWLLVTGLVRFVLVARLAGRALPLVEEEIAAREFTWDE
jgi:hypothetical protein